MIQNPDRILTPLLTTYLSLSRTVGRSWGCPLHYPIPTGASRTLVWLIIFFFVARGLLEAEYMVRDLLLQLWKVGLDINAKSRQFMTVGPNASAHEPQNMSFVIGSQLVSWSRVNEMKCLGSLVSCNASSERAMEHRYHSAEITIAKRSHAFKLHLPFAVKMRAWQSQGQAAAAYGAQILHLSRELLVGMRIWENLQVRRALRLRPHGDEGPTAYNIRASTMVRDAFTNTGVPCLYHRGIKAALKAACKQHGVCKFVLQDRDWHWRAVATTESYKRRKAAGAVQARSGRRTAWDDWLSNIFGPARLITLERKGSCPTGLNKLVDQTCSFFDLPCLPTMKTCRQPRMLHEYQSPAFSLQSNIADLPLREIHHLDDNFPQTALNLSLSLITKCLLMFATVLRWPVQRNMPQTFIVYSLNFNDSCRRVGQRACCVAQEIF